MSIVWKDIDGWEGIYQINRNGKVRSLPRHVRNGRGYRWTKGRLIKSFFAGDYLFYPFVLNGKNTTMYIHILVAKYFVPNPLNLPEVNHKNGIKTDNRPKNLEWCTHQGNVDHAKAIGLIPNGEKKPNAKLKGHQVLRILKIKNRSHSSIAKTYGVSAGTISCIRRGKKWKHLQKKK